MSAAYRGDTRQRVIEHGQHILEEAGTQAICSVCISNGGSCCAGCPFLIDGVGCQSRNTSCTAWLCGFLEYMFHEVSLLQKWNAFWLQVPGMDFRRDDTPAQFEVSTWLEAQDLRALADAFASDLQTHLANHDVNINDFNYLLQLHVSMRTTPQSVYNKEYVEAKTRQMRRIFSTFHRLLETRNQI